MTRSLVQMLRIAKWNWSEHGVPWLMAMVLLLGGSCQNAECGDKVVSGAGGPDKTGASTQEDGSKHKAADKNREERKPAIGSRR